MPHRLIEQKVELLEPKGQYVLQKTFDEYANVPDIKPDMDRIIQSSGEISILKQEILEDQLLIEGNLKVNVLYLPLNDKKPVHQMELSIPFEEILNVDRISPKDYIQLEHVMEDFTTTLQNSRKLSTKALVEFKVSLHEKKEAMIVSDVETSEEVEKRITRINVCQLEDAGKFAYRIKDEFLIPSGKPNIGEILWHDTTLSNKEIKLMEGKLNVKGNLHIATLYMAEDSDHHLEFIENEIGFNGMLDCPASKETMLQDAFMQLSSENLHINLDPDGEERVIAVDADLGIDLKLYSDQEIKVIQDMYSLEKELIIAQETIPYRKLLCKNQSQSNIKETLRLDGEDSEILQVYYTGGSPIVDEVKIIPDKVLIEGAIGCKVMVVAADDLMPIRVFESFVPFEHGIDVKGITTKSKVNVRPVLNYIGCTMIGDKEIELKCNLQFNTIAFEDETVTHIRGIEEAPLDLKSIQKIPGIVGYIVGEKDTLWDIAKKYKTKSCSIMKTNGLEEEKLVKGCPLIIVKEIQL